MRKSHSKSASHKSRKSAPKACWKGYKMVGMKKKRGKRVPNCVPK